MEWIIVAIIGAILGGIISFAALGLRMPQSLTILVGVIGALAGGLIADFTHFSIFGPYSFYIAGAGLSIALLAGSLLGFSLTNEERRI